MALQKFNHPADVSEIADGVALDGFSNSVNKFNFAGKMDFNVDGSTELMAVSPVRQVTPPKEATVPLQNAVQSVVAGPVFNVGPGAIFNYYCAPPPALPEE